MELNKNILEIELNEEQTQELLETLQNWKEEQLAEMEDQLAVALDSKKEELEEENEIWKEEYANNLTDKFFNLLEEVSGEVKASLVAESIAADPIHKVMEEIKRLVAPLMDEEYVGNTYLEEIKHLRETVKTFQEEKDISEGAETLDNLLEGYSKSTQVVLRKIIGEGTAEEVEDKFYEIIESFDEESEDGEDLYEDFDFDDLDEDFEDGEEVIYEDFDFDDLDEEISSLTNLFEEESTPRKSSMLDLL